MNFTNVTKGILMKALSNHLTAEKYNGTFTTDADGTIHLTINPKVDPQEWIFNAYLECLNDDTVFYSASPSLKTVACVGKGAREGDVGMSRCHPEDVWDMPKGIAIAYARCVGMDIPEEIYE